MSDLSPKAQAIVDAARADDVSPGASKSRIKRRVLARVATAAAIGTAAATTSKTATSLAAGGAAGTASLASGGAASTAVAFGGAKLVVGVVLSALVAGSTATGVVVWRRNAAPVAQVGSRTPALSSAPVRAGDARAPRIAPALASKPATVPQLPQTEAPMAVAPSPAAPALAGGVALHPAVPRGTPLESRTEGLEEELPLLQGAQRALRSGDPQQAIALLELHAKRFPKGALAEERRAVHAMASCRMSSAAARAEADQFLRDEGSSPLVERVRDACVRLGVDGLVGGGGSR